MRKSRTLQVFKECNQAVGLLRRYDIGQLIVNLFSYYHLAWNLPFLPGKLVDFSPAH